MEFIPIKNFADKRKKNKKGRDNADESEPPRKQFKKEKHPKLNNKLKPKPPVKSVKNKYNERLKEKQKEKSKKKKLKEESIEEEKEPEDVNETIEDVEDEQGSDENEVDSEVGMDEDVEKEENVGDDDGDDDEEEEEEEKLKKDILKKKKEIDEKMKNRLYIKLKKKIRSEAQIKALHENIKGVLFPRKKNSCWCWAVFASEERANEALKKLKKNKEIIATKPLPREQVEKRLKEKKSDVLRRMKSRKKLESMWL